MVRTVAAPDIAIAEGEQIVLVILLGCFESWACDHIWNILFCAGWVLLVVRICCSYVYVGIFLFICDRECQSNNSPRPCWPRFCHCSIVSRNISHLCAYFYFLVEAPPQKAKTIYHCLSQDLPPSVSSLATKSQSMQRMHSPVTVEAARK